MVPELGSFAIILALCFSLIQSSSRVTQIGITAAIGQFSFLIFAMLCLIISFLNNDMSVIYVREHSHSLLPFLYRVCAAWGGHEGSMLLWVVLLSFWMLMVSFFSSASF